MPEPEELIYFTAWLMLHDKDFQRAHRPSGWESWPRGPLSYLVSLSQRLNGPLSKVLVISCTETDGSNLRRHGTDIRLVRQVFDDLDAYAVDEPSLPAMRVACGNWLIKRALKVGTDKATILLNAGDVEKARQSLSDAQYRTQDNEPPLTLAAGGEAVLRQRWRKDDAVPTGIMDIDKAWHGGTRIGELGLMVGPTGLGKSMMIARLAAAAFWSNRYTLYFTTELSKEQILERITLGILMRGKSDLPTDFELSKLLLKAADEQGEELGANAGIEVRDGSMPILGLPAELETFKETHGAYPGLLLLDDPADLAPPGRFEKGYEGFRASWTYLRMNVAKELGIPVWCVGQANSAAVDKARVSLRNIGDAFAKAQKSHYVLGIAQTEEQQRDQEGKKMNLHILKDSLHGTTGAELLVEPHWGSGDNGYPGLDVLKTRGLNFTLREERPED